MYCMFKQVVLCGYKNQLNKQKKKNFVCIENRKKKNNNNETKCKVKNRLFQIVYLSCGGTSGVVVVMFLSYINSKKIKGNLLRL